MDIMTIFATNKILQTISILKDKEYVEIQELYAKTQNSGQFDEFIILINLFASICFSRNNKFCFYFTEFFPYLIILEYIKKETLPYELRASFARLILVLYLDREPHYYKTKPDLIFKINEENQMMQLSLSKRIIGAIKNLSPSGKILNFNYF